MLPKNEHEKRTLLVIRCFSEISLAIRDCQSRTEFRNELLYFVFQNMSNLRYICCKALIFGNRYADVHKFGGQEDTVRVCHLLLAINTESVRYFFKAIYGLSTLKKCFHYCPFLKIKFAKRFIETYL